MWVMALRREATPADDRTWQIITFDEKPDYELGGIFVDEEDDAKIQWVIDDIFQDEGND